MSDSPRDHVAQFYSEVINGQQLDALDRLVAEDFVDHGTPPTTGRDGFRGFLSGRVEGLPNVELHVDDWIVEGDRVVARCRVSGTHRGEFLGYAPTGRRVEWTAIHIWRVSEGRLAERWSQADMLRIVEQLKGKA
ncbi:MAG: ester cyclase [Candidatus Limnocylindria bacterium]